VDNIEFINVSKDDALAYPQVVHLTYPSTINARMENTVAPFVRKSLDVMYVVLNIFNDKLGLPEGTLESLHAMDEHSACEVRCTRSPPLHDKAAMDRAMLAAHTDFGSLVGRSIYVGTVVTEIFASPDHLAQSAWWTPSDAPWSRRVVLYSSEHECLTRGRRSPTHSPSLDMPFAILRMR
jgi:hypothetical protein